MSKWDTFSKLGRKAADIAADKATEKVATTIIENVGPPKFLGIAGLVAILIGLAIGIGAWYFLTGWLFGLSMTFAVLLVVVGYALRGFKGFLVGLIVRALKGIAGFAFGFVRKRLPQPSTAPTTTTEKK